MRTTVSISGSRFRGVSSHSAGGDCRRHNREFNSRIASARAGGTCNSQLEEFCCGAPKLAKTYRWRRLGQLLQEVGPLTEAQIQEGLDVVLEERTAIVIAHRLSTIKAADRIIVLREGRIIEEGNHDTLMAGGGHYAELYNTYYRHQSLEYIEAWHRVEMAGGAVIGGQ